MAEWVFIENDIIVEYHDKLPKNWRNYSGLDLSINDTAFLQSIGWYKIQKNHQPFNENTHRFKSLEYTIQNNTVTESTVTEPLLQEEIDFKRNYNFQLFLNGLREERNRLLSECDWTQVADVVAQHNAEWNQAWQTYRQELRDMPMSYTEITQIEWPIKPNVAS